MLNIGLIGNTDILEPHVKELQKNKNINIIGKSSVGSNVQLNSFHFSIPELNKVELIDRADIIIMDNSSSQPYLTMSDIVKKSKHIFAIEYLDLTVDECLQLIKLSNESGSVIQVTNPYFYTPIIQWINEHISSPTFIDISNFTLDTDDAQSLYPVLLMLYKATGITPKKVGAVSFESKSTDSRFTNVRLEFSDASVVNINYGKVESLSEFRLKAYSSGQFVTVNFTNRVYNCDNVPIDLRKYSKVNEFYNFINAVQNKAPKTSSLEDYLIAMHVIQKINKKLSQFSTE